MWDLMPTSFYHEWYRKKRKRMQPFTLFHPVSFLAWAFENLIAVHWEHYWFGISVWKENESILQNTDQRGNNCSCFSDPICDFFSLFFYCLASLSARIGFVLISSAFLTFVDFWFHTHLHPLHIFDISQLLADFLFSHISETAGSSRCLDTNHDGSTEQ